MGNSDPAAKIPLSEVKAAAPDTKQAAKRGKIFLTASAILKQAVSVQRHIEEASQILDGRG